MTDNAVDYNLRRVEFFLNFSGKLPRTVKGMGNLEVLMEGYSRLMDVFGAGKDQLSLLLLEADDFKEMQDYAKQKEEYRLILAPSDDFPTFGQVFALSLLTFRDYHYTWWVKQINSYETILP